jgi:hypothetical protein
MRLKQQVGMGHLRNNILAKSNTGEVFRAILAETARQYCTFYRVI